ncbi:MAG: YraN family protein [Jannaschia helgolandensis]|jgi:putative endonuclease|uniref:Putative endonuclease n=1 Tax=Jannaschia helgolandensis TaxID=188906 RepID=A0A1H7IB39_9RHOB|nr:YraN family protein [Jannaschia helgolandensis]SEK58957.1 putative endonuclease [Jannaschia helgolandensis]|tara:strand:+ start:2140 stop:2493 length:354 start_codon:yes stop_codon:yes gene_type:complete
MSGSVSYHAGLAAEDSVARHYSRSGHRVVERRWRGKGGEIDVIAQFGGDTIFIEVKKSDSHAAAALRVSDRQVRRLFDCAGEYMGGLPDGMLSSVRFDVALVDAAGRIEIIENALAA